MKYLFLIFLIIFTGCSKKEKPISFSLGKYVYEDDANVLHSDENCIKLKYGRDEHGHSMYAKLPIDTIDLVEVDRVCARCVTTEIYEHLKSICSRNEINLTRRWLFNKLEEANYNVDSYSMFVKDLSDTSKRKKLYETACDEGWNIGNYEEFSSCLGFKPLYH